VADVLHTDRHGLTGAGLTDGDKPDVIFMVDTPAPEADFFLIHGLGMPIKGNAVIMGVIQNGTLGDGTCAGGPREAPTMTLEWVQSHILWLKPALSPKDGVMAFEAVDVTPQAALNVLSGYEELETGGEVKVAVEDMLTGKRGPLSDIITAVRSRLH
jgi:hypothetical protein